MSNAPVRCTAHPGGYSATHCDALSRCVEWPGRRYVKGLVAATIVDLNSGVSLGKQVRYQNSDNKGGLVLNVCPFCAGPLRDLTSRDEAED
ncbi:hypothetical protein [Aeromonas phage BUCT552]|nr:hypothetical protein [Aeromonas phage BUCT552]